MFVHHRDVFLRSLKQDLMAETKSGVSSVRFVQSVSSHLDVGISSGRTPAEIVFIARIKQHFAKGKICSRLEVGRIAWTQPCINFDQRFLSKSGYVLTPACARAHPMSRVPERTRQLR